MDDCRDTAFYLTVWYAVLGTVVTVLLIVLNDVNLATGLLIAANAALLFALGLMTGADRLSDKRILRGQFWRTLPLARRPPGEAGLRVARKALEETWLRFAKGAAAAAIALAGLAYASNGVSAQTWDKALRMPAFNQFDPGKPLVNYRSARLLPTN